MINKPIEGFNSMIDYLGIRKHITKTINVELDSVIDKKLVLTNNTNCKLDIWIKTEMVDRWGSVCDREVGYFEFICQDKELVHKELNGKSIWHADLKGMIVDKIKLLKYYNKPINFNLKTPLELISKSFMIERNAHRTVYMSGYSGETKTYCNEHCVVAYVAFPELIYMIIKKKRGGLQAWKITSERITTWFDLSKCAKIINKYITQKPEYVEVSEKLMSEIIASKV